MPRNILVAITLALLLDGAGMGRAQTTDARVADLVATGKLRVGLFSTQYVKDAQSGELKGVRVDLARAFAARLGVTPVLIEHRTPPEVVGCLKSGACDLVFLPFDERAAAVGDFSHPIVQSDYTLLVPAGSTVGSLAAADQVGTRIAAVRDHASTMALAAKVRYAEIIPGDDELAAFEILRSGRADVLASTRQFLLKVADKLPGSRVLAGYYGANLNRMVVPKGRAGWLASVNDFVEQAKASGLVQQAIDRDPTAAFRVAPPGDAD